jgi:hypothetical protein
VAGRLEGDGAGAAELDPAVAELEIAAVGGGQQDLLGGQGLELAVAGGELEMPRGLDGDVVVAGLDATGPWWAMKRAPPDWANREMPVPALAIRRSAALTW